jgi:hypothetical protein
LLRRRFEWRLRRAQGNAEDEDGEVVRVATEAERRRLIELRENGAISDVAFQQVEQELDLRELELLEIAES